MCIFYALFFSQLTNQQPGFIPGWRVLHTVVEHFLTLYRPISQLPEDSKLAFALKEQYLNNYKRYHHDRHAVGEVFSLRIR